MLEAADPQEQAKGFHVHLEDADIAALMQALLASEGRVQQLHLSVGSVWIKRQGAEKAPWWLKLQSLAASALPYKFLKPSPTLAPGAMMAREKRRMIAFGDKGFPVPEIIYASETAIVLSDVGPTVQRTLKSKRRGGDASHDALLIDCAAAIGDLHAAGLCHGRPHVRDFFLSDGRIGFMDFEEEPEAAMPLETAQARDLWLLFLPLSTLAQNGRDTLDAAYNAWASRAPKAAIAELRRLVHVLSRFLPLARLIGRVQIGSDLQRFIVATEYLKNAVKPEAAG
ncbi:lipopolysaccharide kinase InaA family protein [Agrobacterium rubi]|uniref:Serine/threonine protein phosphatase n=1 Tax=Agrobacterium rubi TaxID=28099 RepID=A0AAE7R8K5_9HYPH|nr:lipopolysaccharide kinase InaA family protein [Agrobacterium rubi]NTE85196.1 serine/threonine protein phosphatase [Agrobacterium rubi]NTF01128.1 serine/threonine protein phosphatase [Agrobacterium rubi]NTF35316.1 serine/threonine protein phosphatase [Agrobacterium rubi]OCJ48667.1 serine/threonine protein phosphatase [Agrobacterium rubi]QTG00516.1 serine/threonine protein phosphatase [Agrobacterium rubi]